MILPRVVRSGVTPYRCLGAAPGDAKAGDHFVEEQQRARLGAQPARGLQEPRLRRHDAHVAGDRLDDHAGDLVAAGGEDCARAAASLYSTRRVSAVVAAVTPGLSGSAKVRTPLPAAARNGSAWPW